MYSGVCLSQAGGLCTALGHEVMRISCQTRPRSPEPARLWHCRMFACSGMDICSWLHAFYKSTNVMSKETTLVMYLEVKYFIQYYCDVIDCLPDIAFCLRSRIWDHLWGWTPASSPLWCLLCLFHGVLNSFLSLQNAKKQLNPSSWQNVNSDNTMVIVWALGIDRTVLKQGTHSFSRHNVREDLWWWMCHSVSCVPGSQQGGSGQGVLTQMCMSVYLHVFLYVCVCVSVSVCLICTPAQSVWFLQTRISWVSLLYSGITQTASQSWVWLWVAQVNGMVVVYLVTKLPRGLRYYKSGLWRLGVWTETWFCLIPSAAC